MLKVQVGNFPDGQCLKNPSSNAENTGSAPAQGTKIPHAMGQLNLRASTKRSLHDTSKTQKTSKYNF